MFLLNWLISILPICKISTDLHGWMLIITGAAMHHRTFTVLCRIIIARRILASKLAVRRLGMEKMNDIMRLQRCSAEVLDVVQIKTLRYIHPTKGAQSVQLK